MSILWSSPDLLPKKLLFVDGITRSGKSMVSPVISSFKRSYAFQHQAILDNLMPLIRKDAISKSAAKSLITFYFNQNIYNLNISRQINLRPKDNSSLLNDKNYKLFKKNLKKKEGDYVIKEIKKKNYLPIYISHDLLSMINHFDKLKFPYQIIYTYRHPIDNIFSLIKRYEKVKANNKLKYNYNNPRIYGMMIKKNNILLPYYTAGKEKYFLSLNHAEKYVFYYLDSLKNSISSYKRFHKKKKILFLRYDDFASDTNRQIKKISNFLKLKVSNYTKKSLRLNKLPRKIDLEYREGKRKILQKILRKEIYDEVIKFSQKYENISLF